MQTPRKFFLIASLAIAVCYEGMSQDTLVHRRAPLSLQLSFFNHSISVPFHKIFNATVHPGIQTSIEGRYRETRRSKLFQTFNLGLFYNKYNCTGFYTNTELAYRYKTKHRLFFEALIGGGYLRMYHPTDIYALTSSGTYERVRDKGFSSALFSFAIGVGYDIPSSSKYSFSPFLRYQSLLQTRYRPDVGVLPQSTFHIGVRFNLKRS